MTVVKLGRSYNAPRRAQQAAATRADIISAASKLFAERGYAATTMAAIAGEAQVTPKSVYALAEKPQLLLLAVDRAIVGDDEPIALFDRAPMQAVLSADDPQQQARLAARLAAAMLLRLYPIHRAFDQGAATEPALRAAWRDSERRRRTDVEKFVAAVAGAGGLHPALSVGRATDTLWALIGWYPVALLVEEHGWGEAEVADWLEAVLIALLAPAPGAGPNQGRRPSA